ncbi:MAG: pilus assembly protein PilM [Nitrospiraceae bacterium]|nr:pilus assembly protein PilM [Nitrospiraceae bacterium]
MQAINRLPVLAAGVAARLAAVAARVGRVALFSPADDLMYPQRNVTAALDKGSVSLVFGSRFLSRVSVKAVREYRFDESRYPLPDELASSFSLSANEMGAARADISLVIPKAWAIIKTVEFPATVRDNLPDVIRYELDRITPFPADEAYYDFRVLGERNGRLELVVVAARTDTVMPYLAALNEKGIRVTRLIVDLHALMLFSRHLGAGRESLFLKIDPKGFEGALMTQEKPTAVFSGDFSGDDERGWADRIGSDLKAVSGDSGPKGPEVVILLQDVPPSFRELLKSRLPGAVRFLGETDLKMKISSAANKIPYAAVAGLYQSVRPDQFQVNLLRKGLTVRQKAPYALSLLLLAGIAAAGILYVVAPLRIEQNRLDAIASQISSKKDEVKKIEALQKNIGDLQAEINTVNDFKPAEPVTLNYLKEITTILPKSAWISRLKFSKSTVDLEGYAGSANELLPKLEASRYFKKVEFAQPTFRDSRMNADRFVIRMEIEGAVKAVPVTPPAQKGEPAKNAKK